MRLLGGVSAHVHDEHVLRFERFTYRTPMRLLAGVSAHVHDEHVLRFERFLCPGAFLPPTHEGLLVRMDVITVDVLQHKKSIFYQAVWFQTELGPKTYLSSQITIRLCNTRK